MMKNLLTGMALLMLTSATQVCAQDTYVKSTLGKVCAVRNGEVNIPVVLKNVKVDDIKNLTLTIDVAGRKQQVKVTPENVRTSGNDAVFYVTAETPSETGLSDVCVTVDAINDIKMQTAENKAKGSLMTVSRKVPHKVVVEEFTGMWCQACPTGIVGIERTKLNYGNKVLVLTAHYTDVLYCDDYASVINTVLCFPRATVDRDPNIGIVNPYLGSERGDNGAKYGLGFDIDEQMAIDPVVEVKVGGDLNEKMLTIKSEFTMLYNGEANLGVAYVVTQDSLSNPNWKQENYMPLYYRGHDIVNKEPLWDKWINGDLEMTGIVYDDVIRIANSALEGIDGVIPATVSEEQVINHEISIDLNDYRKVSTTDNLNLCVFVIDRNTGKIVNSASEKLSEATAIDGVNADNENVDVVARYTADGRRISIAEKGINIVKYSDGTVRKELVR